jgi:Tol biopolymer transport system component
MVTSDGVGGQFATSDTGTLVYLSDQVRRSTYVIASLDAAGKTTPLVGPPGPYFNPRLSPDGKWLAYNVVGPNGPDVWVYDVGRQTATQLTFSGASRGPLAWAPDSKHLAFSDPFSLLWTRADGSIPPHVLLKDLESPSDVSLGPAMGNTLRLAYEQSDGGLPDIWTVPLDMSDPDHPKPGKPEPFLADPKKVEVVPAFSPDGKFLAYNFSDPGQRGEIYVQTFPGHGGKWKIADGRFPTWTRSTHELFFLGDDDRIMVMDYTIQGDSFSAGKPRVWSPAQVLRTGVNQDFDVSADGKRVIMFPKPSAEQSQSNLHAIFLLNFFDEVRRKVPAGK